jgi:hypothetical protein
MLGVEMASTGEVASIGENLYEAHLSKFDKRAAHRCYNRGKPCANTRVSPCIFPIHTTESIQAYPNCDRPDGRSRTNGSTVCRRPAQTPL